MTKYGVFIGRFQPFHAGHVDVVEYIKSEGYTPLILVGTSTLGWRDKDPYTYADRREMIQSVYPGIEVKPLLDIPGDNDAWAKSVYSIIGAGNEYKIFYHRKAEDVTNGLHYIEECFDSCEIQQIPEALYPISGTQVRDVLKYVPKPVLGCIAQSPFLKIKRNDYYYYAERLGVDSVAFILYNKDTGLYGLINEYKPPIDQFLITAFGGSLDKPMPLEDIVREECIEESGYEAAGIATIGKHFVSTQMNQFCHLYLVTVGKFVGKTSVDPVESRASVVWMKKEDILKLEDWKAKVIIGAV